MKKNINYILLAASFFYFSCESPAPTQLEADMNVSSDKYNLEIPVENTAAFASSDYDSLGLISDTTAESLIVINGISWDQRIINRYVSLGKAVFYEKEVITNPNGKIISKKSKKVNSVNFGANEAKEKDNKVSYRENGRIKDTIVGPQYIIYNNRPGLGFDFPYKSVVNVQIKAPGINRDIMVETPSAITGTVETAGKRSEGSLSYKLKWEGASQENIEIVLGGYLKGSSNIFPVYKFVTADDGSFTIPRHLLNAVNFEFYDSIDISLIRKIQKIDTSDKKLGKTLIIAQCIHNMRVDIPD